MDKGIIDARALAYYVSRKYEEFTNHTCSITNLKLQKTLYFLFAMWGGFIEKSKRNESEFQTSLSSILFDNEIQAWVYGPVVPDVFLANKNPGLKKYEFDEANFFAGEKKLLKETIDSIMNDIFEVSDFKLVSISHEDKCWQNHFNPLSSKHNEAIPKKEIILEYASKECV